jgi:manganese transport protein
MFRLPTTATAPFCPSEVRGSIRVPAAASWWSKLKQFWGPGLLIAIGYMDPGNWATDIQGGSQFGYTLLWVVVLSSGGAIFLQLLAARLGLVTGQDLAQLSRTEYATVGRTVQWLSAEIAIVACDVAEVLGSALAFKLLLGMPIAWGVVFTAFDTVIVLGLQGRGFRQLEAIVAVLIATMMLCFVVQLWLVQTDWLAVAQGLVPIIPAHNRNDALVLALGIVGATIMPHNLYLHSSIVQTRHIIGGNNDIGQTLTLSRIDTLGALLIAMGVNAAILILAGSAFHATASTAVVGIEQAYRLIVPLVGSGAALLFGLGLLASGQSSTLTGTIAGQVIMDGFLRKKIPCYQRRLITRALALVPALIGVLMMGDTAVGKLLVWSQVVLSLQLPLAMWPLIRMTSNPVYMKAHANSLSVKLLAWILFTLITGANFVLLGSLAD